MNSILLIGIILLVSITYWHFKIMYLHNQTLKYKYKLFELRDNLRLLAIEKKIDVDSLGFVFLDSSISGIISKLDCINIFAILIYRNRINSLQVQIVTTLINEQIKRNPELVEINKVYHKTLLNYIKNKHFVISAFLWIKRNLVVTKFSLDIFNVDYLIQENGRQEKYKTLPEELRERYRLALAV